MPAAAQPMSHVVTGKSSASMYSCTRGRSRPKWSISPSSPNTSARASPRPCSATPSPRPGRPGSIFSKSAQEIWARPDCALRTLRVRPLRRRRGLFPQTLPRSVFRKRRRMPPHGAPAHGTQITGYVGQLEPVARMPQAQRRLPALLRLPVGCAARQGQPRGTQDSGFQPACAPHARRTLQSPAGRDGLYLLHI